MREGVEVMLWEQVIPEEVVEELAAARPCAWAGVPNPCSGPVETRLRRQGAVPRASAVVGFEVSHDFPGTGHRTMLVSARRLLRAGAAHVDVLVFARVADPVRVSI